MAASTSQRQDRSYYKSLYKFDADVELAEYSLPVLSTQIGGAKGPGGPGLGKQNSGIQKKTPSGVINSTQLPPLQNQSQRQSQHPQRIEEDAADQMTDEMEMDQNAYEQMEGMEMEEEEADDGELNFDSLRNVIEKSEDKSKD